MVAAPDWIQRSGILCHVAEFANSINNCVHTRLVILTPLQAEVQRSFVVAFSCVAGRRAGPWPARVFPGCASRQQVAEDQNMIY